MNCYQIAGISICVKWEKEEEKSKYYRYRDCIILPRSLAAFHKEEIPHKPDLTVWVRGLSQYTGPEKYKKIYNQSFYLIEDRMIMTVHDPYRGDTPGYSIAMAEDYSYAEYIPHIREYEHYDLQWMMYPFEGRVLYKGGIVLHGAAIDYSGKGIIFTGISGAGKSTQAHLWQRYRDAYIINGDCPAIRMEEGVPVVYGTPWCGSSGEYINRKTVLSAVVLVKRGKENSLKELHGMDALLMMLANVLRSNFDECSLDYAVDNLKSMIDQIRVFEMNCTISEEAVRILESELI